MGRHGVKEYKRGEGPTILDNDDAAENDGDGDDPMAPTAAMMTMMTKPMMVAMMTI